MDWYGQVSGLLFVVTDALLLPVMLLLLLLLAGCILLAGDLLGEAVARQRARPLPHHPEVTGTRLVAEFVRAAEGCADPPRLRLLARGAEDEGGRRLQSARLATRLGPTLGLIGTLIPMGPALYGLSQGDLQSVSENVRIAFATTVCGLAAGAIAFVALTIRRRWVTADLSAIEYLLDRQEQQA